MEEQVHPCTTWRPEPGGSTKPGWFNGTATMPPFLWQMQHNCLKIHCTQQLMFLKRLLLQQSLQQSLFELSSESRKPVLEKSPLRWETIDTHSSVLVSASTSKHGKVSVWAKTKKMFVQEAGNRGLKMLFIRSIVFLWSKASFERRVKKIRVWDSSNTNKAHFKRHLF